MATTTHNVRTVMTMTGNMKTEITKVGNQITRVAKTQHHWENGVKTTTKSVDTFAKKTSGLSKSLNGAAMRFIGITVNNPYHPVFYQHRDREH